MKISLVSRNITRIVVACASAGLLSIAGAAVTSTAQVAAAPAVHQAAQPNPYQDIRLTASVQQASSSTGPNEWDE
jgi:hypothetical protein